MTETAAKATPASNGKAGEDRDRSRGVWVAREPDRSAVCVFASEIAALRHGMGSGMQVVFVPFGQDAATYKAAAPKKAS